MSKCICGCGRELPESKGKPRKFYNDSCRMKYNRRGESEQVVLGKANEIGGAGRKANEIIEKLENEEDKTNKIEKKANKPEKANKLSSEQTKKLLAETKRAVWSDVLANPDQKYSEAVIESCGGSPNALFAASAREFVEAERKAGRWDHEKRYAFREEIF